MYKRSVQGWLKHYDFILWDVLILQVAFIFGYMIRHGWGEWPYLRADYRALAIVLMVVDVLVAIVFNTMHNVMKRSPAKEFRAMLKHSALVVAIMSLYLFSTQRGDTYSRITIYLTAVFHLISGYGIRMVWKPVVRRINKGKAKSIIILVADEEAVEEIRKKAAEAESLVFSGLVLSNRDATGEKVSGIHVVASLESAADYICREWVDEVFISPEVEAAEGFASSGNTGELIRRCREMAIPVHIRLPLSSENGKSIVEKAAGYNVLTMTANYAEPFELLLKRLTDIIGGFFGSLITLVILAIVRPKIKKESPGPALFRQTRIGLNGKPFIVYRIGDTEKQQKHAVFGKDTDQNGTVLPFKQLCFS